MTVVDFPTQETKVWQCAHCGCQTFFLHSDGNTECALCHHFSEGERGRWADWQDPDDATDPAPQPVRRAETVVGTPAEALRFVLNRANPETCKAVVVIGENGLVTAWGDTFDTDELAAWLDDKLGDARRILLKRGDD